jgi:hypothetical protein
LKLRKIIRFQSDESQCYIFVFWCVHWIIHQHTKSNYPEFYRHINNDYTFSKGASSFPWIQAGRNYPMSQFNLRGENLPNSLRVSGSVVKLGNVLLVLCICACTFISSLQDTHHQFVTVHIFPFVLLYQKQMNIHILWSKLVTELFGSSLFVSNEK